MEKQGIITGVGNEITPEIDAVLNDFIVGKNTIISGLDWNGNTLNAGVCQLCGYRGVLEHPINNLTDDYVYGKFELHFDKNIEDKFSIETSASRIANDDPTSITIEGTYYLLLYYKKKGFDEYNYPNMAHTSSRSALLVENGIIESTATTAMSKTAEGNLKVNMHITDPQMVANTEYVHKQIVVELGYDKQVVDISMNGVGYNLTFEKKARYCLISYNISLQSRQPLKTEFQVPSGFEPANDSEAIIFLKGFTNAQYVYKLYVTTAGVASIVLIGVINEATPSMGTLYAGYKI